MLAHPPPHPVLLIGSYLAPCLRTTRRSRNFIQWQNLSVGRFPTSAKNIFHSFPQPPTPLFCMPTIGCLPPEILAMIFEVGFGDGDLSFVRGVSLTCRAWYRLAIDIPRLWSCIAIGRCASVDRIAVWLERSRFHPLDITISLLPLELLGTYDEQDQQLREMQCKGIEMGKLIHLHIGRWRKMNADSWGKPDGSKADADDEKASWDPVYEHFGHQPFKLEELSINWSGAGKDPGEFGSRVGGYPKLRKVTLEKTVCHWAPHYMVPSLTHLSLLHVDDLGMDALLGAVNQVPLLEEIRLDGVTWDTSSSGDQKVSPVTLPQLLKLDISSSTLHHFVCNLILPKLHMLALWEIPEDLSPTFRHLTITTSSIEHIATGMWDEEPTYASQQRSLLDLVTSQRRLDTLRVRNAVLSDDFIRALTPVPATEPIAPMLKELEIPVENINQQLLPTLVQTRNLEGSNVCRLQHLVLLGDVAGSTREAVSPCVDILRVEYEPEDSEMSG